MIQKPVKLYCFQAFFIYQALGKTGNSIRKRTQASLGQSYWYDCSARPRWLIRTGMIVRARGRRVKKTSTNDRAWGRSKNRT